MYIWFEIACTVKLLLNGINLARNFTLVCFLKSFPLLQHRHLFRLLTLCSFFLLPLFCFKSKMSTIFKGLSNNYIINKQIHLELQILVKPFNSCADREIGCFCIQNENEKLIYYTSMKTCWFFSYAVHIGRHGQLFQNVYSLKCLTVFKVLVQDRTCFFRRGLSLEEYFYLWRSLFRGVHVSQWFRLLFGRSVRRRAIVSGAKLHPVR